MGKRCAREGCRAWAVRGGERCRSHTPQAARRLPVEDLDEAGDDPRAEWAAREAEFSRRLAGGKYRDLLEKELAAIIAEAGRGGSLIDEIGALRLVQARLLTLERDPQRLAVSVPRVVAATVRALKAQRTLAGEAAGDLTEALTRVLLEMGLGE